MTKERDWLLIDSGAEEDQQHLRAHHQRRSGHEALDFVRGLGRLRRPNRIKVPRSPQRSINQFQFSLHPRN